MYNWAVIPARAAIDATWTRCAQNAKPRSPNPSAIFRCDMLRNFDQAVAQRLFIKRLKLRQI
jgi:hypothetical protein